MSKKVTAPLLDRLIDFEPHKKTEKDPLRAFTLPQLYASIQRDLLWLFNTRAFPQSKEDLKRPIGMKQQINDLVKERFPRSVVNFGVFDFSALYTASSHEQDRLASMLREAIVNFEPRLKNVTISVETIVQESKKLLVTMNAVLKVEGVVQPLSFAVTVKNKLGEIEVYEG